MLSSGKMNEMFLSVRDRGRIVDDVNPQWLAPGTR
jgi:hypothetical protein